MTSREFWLLGRKDARSGIYNPPPLLPEFGGAKDMMRLAYDRGHLGLKF